MAEYDRQRTLFLVQRNDETTVGRATLGGAIAEAHRLQAEEPHALVTIADTRTHELVLGWWLLDVPEVAGAITADGPVPSPETPDGWGRDWV
jgi:hypothetical protein